jgi:hypothetical protein
LTESLDIALESAGGLKLHLANGDESFTAQHGLETNFEFGDELNDEGLPVIKQVNLSCQAIMKKDDIEGLTAHIMKGDEKIEFTMSMEKVDNPPDDIVLKARLQSANQKIFDLI